MTDKDKLTERFEDLISDADCESDGWQSTYTFETVKQLMHSAYDLAKEEDAWISVEDRLPENRSHVLVSVTHNMFQAEYKHWCFFDDLIRISHVTHWRPLPSPPINQTTK